MSLNQVKICFLILQKLFMQQYNSSYNFYTNQQLA